MQEDEPAGRILVLLLANVGPTFLLLSSTAPLLQCWVGATFLGGSTYRLYALSNAGSLLALLSYPFLLEPLLRLPLQAKIWSWGYAGFVLVCAWCAVRARGLAHSSANDAVTETLGARKQNGSSAQGSAAQESAISPSPGTVLFWLCLAGTGSALLLATTNQISQEVPVVPFLWVLPLALYLLSFILCFDNERWYRRRAFGLLLRVMVPLAFGMLVAGAWVKLWIQIVVFLVTLFIGCMACHGELVRARPHPRFLTLFYLAAAAGGALGAVFVALVAPRLFVGYWEHHLALGACCLLTLAGWYRAGAWKPTLAATLKPPPVILILMLAMFYALTFPSNETALVKSRNFYGLLRLTESSDDNGRYVKLTHGQIMHGFQYTDKEKRRWPTAYYGFQSGIGLALEYHPRRQDVDLPDRHLRIGIVELGAGTVAALARQGDFSSGSMRSTPTSC